MRTRPSLATVILNASRPRTQDHRAAYMLNLLLPNPSLVIWTIVLASTGCRSLRQLVNRYRSTEGWVRKSSVIRCD